MSDPQLRRRLGGKGLVSARVPAGSQPDSERVPRSGAGWPGFAAQGDTRSLGARRTVKDIREFVLPPDAPIRKAVWLIDVARCPMVLILGPAGELNGTVTDAELRWALLRGASLEAPVGSIMSRQPETIRENGRGRRPAGRPPAHPLPVVDALGKVVGLEIPAAATEISLADRWAVMMTGGVGTRLHPLTANRPKALLEIGGRPLLELTLESLRSFGLRQFFFCVNYKAAMIEEHFGDGSRFGVRIEYIREQQPLGTAGALSLLPRSLSEAFLVMNADLLTTVDVVRLFEFHHQQRAEATLCIYGYDLQMPYGIVGLDGPRMTGIREQPIDRFLVNAGIYVLEPTVLGLVPQDQLFDMPALFNTLVVQWRPTAAFPIREYWLDIGRISDFERANADYPALLQMKRRRAAAAG